MRLPLPAGPQIQYNITGTAPQSVRGGGGLSFVGDSGCSTVLKVSGLRERTEMTKICSLSMIIQSCTGLFQRLESMHCRG